jgi:hypothetical protein
MDLREMGCVDGSWMKLAQDRVQWRALVLVALNLRVELPENRLDFNSDEMADCSTTSSEHESQPA